MRSRLDPSRLEERRGGRRRADDDICGTDSGLRRSGLGRQSRAAQPFDEGVRAGRVAADDQQAGQLSDAGDSLRLVGRLVAGSEQGQDFGIRARQGVGRHRVRRGGAVAVHG